MYFVCSYTLQQTQPRVGDGPVRPRKALEMDGHTGSLGELTHGEARSRRLDRASEAAF